MRHIVWMCSNVNRTYPKFCPPRLKVRQTVQVNPSFTMSYTQGLVVETPNHKRKYQAVKPDIRKSQGRLSNAVIVSYLGKMFGVEMVVLDGIESD